MSFTMYDVAEKNYITIVWGGTVSIQLHKTILLTNPLTSLFPKHFYYDAIFEQHSVHNSSIECICKYIYELT